MYYMDSNARGGQQQNPMIENDTNRTRGAKRGRESLGDENATDKGTPRSGKRLTTNEEILLFEICIRRAESFGKRSEMCDWWRAVAADFTATTGRVYSWHSVRRKVEAVTKQRDKLLKTQPSTIHNQDSMNPRWCAVVDEWLPTWRQHEESEAKRIAKRDELMKRRKLAHSRTVPPSRNLVDAVERDSSHAPISDLEYQRHREMEFLRFEAPPSSGPRGAGLADAAEFDDSAHTEEPDIMPTTTPAPSMPHFEAPTNLFATMKLPPGFETMFSNPHPATIRYSNTNPASTGNRPLESPQPPPVSSENMHSVLFPDLDLNENIGTSGRNVDASLGHENSESPNEHDISALVRAAAAANAQAYAEPHAQVHTHAQSHSEPGAQQREESYDSLALDIDHIKEELRRDIKAEMRQEMDRNWVAMEEKVDSVQKTQQLILEMLRQRSS